MEGRTEEKARRVVARVRWKGDETRSVEEGSRRE